MLLNVFENKSILVKENECWFKLYIRKSRLNKKKGEKSMYSNRQLRMSYNSGSESLI